jgi:hypothetical protein
MITLQYQCKFCDSTHDAPLRPGDGTVYIRCAVTRQWAWYEPSSFFLPAEARPQLQTVRSAPAKAAKAGGGGVRARVHRASAAGRRRAPARGSRKTTARKPARAPRKRR